MLISGSGTTLQNLVDHIGDGSLSARVATVIASRPGIGGIDRAKGAGLACEIVDRKKFDSLADFSRQVFDICRKSEAELICLAGWLSLLEIPRDFQGKTINTHPALLPSFGGKGMYGRRVHQAVLDHGCKISGCTIHFVDHDYDSGPIILQRTCPVLDTDDAHALAERVFHEEKIAYPEAISLYQAGRLKIEGRRVRIAHDGTS